MRVNTNISSMMAQRQMANTTKAIGRALARLASGRRINEARDDASGLAISNGLEAQTRGLTQALRNINDSYAVVQTADGAYATQVEIVQRMRDLAMQSANGTLSSKDRGYLNAEFQQLYEEFDRISRITDFNGKKLIDGSFENMSLQVGPAKGQTISFGLENSSAASTFKETLGSASYTLASQFSGNSTWVKVIDLDGDGINDVINRVSNTVTVRLGKADGTFAVSQTFSNTVNQFGAEQVGVGDFNGDGKLDLFLGDPNGVLNSLYTGNGAGRFSLTSTSVSGDVSEVDVGDLNGDGRDDLIYTGASSAESRVALGQASGDLSHYSSLTYSGLSPDINFLLDTANGHNTSAIADFNGDRVLDFLIWVGSDFEIQTGNGDGTFTYWNGGNFGAASGSVAVGDFSGDGSADILYSDEGSGATYMNSVKPSGLQGWQQLAGDFGLLTVHDMNGDGHFDVLSSAGVEYLGGGDGSFTRRAMNSSLYGGVGDLNNDGVTDILNLTGSKVYTQGTELSAPTFMDISNQDHAQRMLDILDNAISDVMGRRADVGAILSRLASTEGVTSIMIENISQARSQILDTDVAAETAEFTRLQILQQAQASVMGQANINLQIVLQLLRF